MLKYKNEELGNIVDEADLYTCHEFILSEDERIIGIKYSNVTLMGFEMFDFIIGSKANNL